MKRILTLIVFCMGYSMVIPANAQIGMPSYSIVFPDSVSNNFYQSEIARGNNITFSVDHSLSTLFQICNIRYTNVFADMIAKYPVNVAPFEKEEEIVATSMQPIYNAFLEVFSPEEIRVLAEEKCFINLCFTLNRDGSIGEIGFAFWNNDPHLYNIPPQYLEKLEEMILPNMSFSVPGWYDRYNIVNMCLPIKFTAIAKQL